MNHSWYKKLHIDFAITKMLINSHCTNIRRYYSDYTKQTLMSCNNFCIT